MATHTPQQLREAGEIIAAAVLAAQDAHDAQTAEPDAAVA
jgi:hypothetical protein